MPTVETSIRQAAALPIKGGKACIITSSNGKRWVIPKGLIEPGQTAGETALRWAGRARNQRSVKLLLDAGGH